MSKKFFAGRKKVWQKIVCVVRTGRQLFQFCEKCGPCLRLVPLTTPETEIAHFPLWPHNILLYYCTCYLNILVSFLASDKVLKNHFIKILLSRKHLLTHREAERNFWSPITTWKFVYGHRNMYHCKINIFFSLLEL